MQKIHYNCQRIKDIHSFLHLEFSKFQTVAYQLFRKMLGASYEHPRYSLKFRLKSVYHEHAKGLFAVYLNEIISNLKITRICRSHFFVFFVFFLINNNMEGQSTYIV